MYATDASIYQMVPLGVVVPRTAADVEATIAIARDAGVPVTARGGGTSQCGQTVNSGLIVDVSRYLREIVSLDTAARRVRVQPGIVLDALNRALKPHGLFFPVDPSTASRATIGGMTANNSSGARSIRYGIMADNVAGVDAVLADGSRAYFGEVERTRDPAASARYGELVDRVRAIAAREAAEIDARIPKVQRNVGGYAIQSIRPDAPFNMARLLVGSEGTLAFFEAIDLALQPLPRAKALGVCHFPAFADAMRSTEALVALDPVAVELVDRTMIELSREIATFAPTMAKVRARRARLAAAGGVRRRRTRAARAQARRAGRRDGRARLSPCGGEADRAGAAGRDVGGARRGPEHHDVDARRCQAGLDHRRLRRAVAASRRLHRAPESHLRQVRDDRDILRARLGRLSARAPGPEYEARRRRRQAACDRRGSVRDRARIRRRPLRRARRRDRAFGVPRRDVRNADRRCVPRREARVRSGQPAQPRQDRGLTEDGRPRAVPLRSGIRARPAPHRTRLVGVGRLHRRRRDVQQQRGVPQEHRRRDVPVVPGDAGRTPRHPRSRQRLAARADRAARRGRPGLARTLRRARSVRLVQSLQARMSDRRRHGADEDRVPRALPRGARDAAGRPDRRRPPARRAPRRPAAPAREPARPPPRRPQAARTRHRLHREAPAPALARQTVSGRRTRRGDGGAARGTARWCCSSTPSTAGSKPASRAPPTTSSWRPATT